MEEKSVTKIKLSTAILFFIIFALIVLSGILYYFGFVNKNEQSTQNDVKTAENSNEVSNKITNSVTNTENTTNKNVKKQEDQGKKLELSSDKVQEIVKKFNFGFCANDFYQVGDFNSTNIPNILKLRLGWSKLSMDELNVDGNTLRETTSRQFVEKNIKNIFGKNIKYEDKTFRFGNTSVFDQLSSDMVYYNKDKEEYESTLFQGGGAYFPFIHEEVQNAIEYDNKVELYVKTAFVDPVNIAEHGEYCTYDIYNNYNFNKEQYENKVASIGSKDFEEGGNPEIQLSTKSNKSIENVLNKLNTYKYTFTKENGEYYLSGFSKE